MTDILVIGGGASGLAAACRGAEAGKKVLILESASRPGRKIMASGNGRCNLLNDGKLMYYGERDFAFSVFQACPREEIRAFFKRAGLLICRNSEEDGRVYPASGQAASVMDALRRYAARLGVQILTEKTAEEILPGKKGFSVRCQEEVFRARRLIAACGSPAGGNLGKDSYQLLTALGHTLIPAQPALTPLLCDMKKRKNLKGLRVPACLTLTRKGKPVEVSGGEILFSETGISGVCAMQLGSQAREGDEMHIDFAPLMDIAPRNHFHEEADEENTKNHDKEIFALLKERSAFLPREDLLTGLLPRTLAEAADPSGKAPLSEISKNLSDFVLSVTGKKGMEAAQVAHGGIRAAEFDPWTMASHRVKGLYGAGEILNVDGDCGGYNLMFAWSTGLLAGENAACSLDE